MKFNHLFYMVFMLGIFNMLIGCASSDHQGKSIFDYEPNSLDATQYTVIKGDTLYSIAFRAGLNFKELASQNNIKPPYAIFPGQVIKLRDKTKGSSTASKQPKKSIKDKQKKVDIAKSQEYVVNQGKQNVAKINNSTVVDTFEGANWQWPAKGSVVARFSEKELGNKGLEIAGKKGSPVFAANSGKVVYAGNALRGYGNLIIIKHSDDYLSAYAHNQVIRVKEQDWIQAGQHIADMGDTDTDSVKLRFEIRYKGNTVDPERFLPKNAN